MRKIAWCLVYCTLMLAGHTVSASAGEFVGLIKSANEKTVIIRGTESMIARHGMEIKPGDVIETDSTGAAAIVFSDDTVISMGPQTSIAVDDYTFEPLEKKLSFVARIVRGTISYLSGQIAKIAPESVRISMPTAVIGVRGTHVLIKVD